MGDDILFMNHHEHSIRTCSSHTCDTCKHEQQKAIPCACCRNAYRDCDNCYWEPKVLNNVLNNELFQIVEEPQFALLQLRRNDLEAKDRRFNEQIVGNCVIDMLKLLSSEQRLEVFSHFCKWCGDKNSKCKCDDTEEEKRL